MLYVIVGGYFICCVLHTDDIITIVTYALVEQNRKNSKFSFADVNHVTTKNVYV